MKKKGNPFIILLIAVAIVGVVSLLPLDKMSSGKLKDFSLLSDITKSDTLTEVHAETYIDPDLEAALADNAGEEEHSGSKAASVPTEGTAIAVSEVPQIVTEQHNEVAATPGIIEDYTPGKNGLKRLRSAISRASGKPARIAMLGDSYIEGDIFSEVVRENLQNRYGGSGAGYIPVSSNIAGFRSSVRQNCVNWKEHDFRKDGKKFATLPGFYYTPAGNSRTTVKGSKKQTRTSNWEQSRLLFISPNDTELKFYNAAGEPVTHSVAGSESLQCLTLPGPSDEVVIECSDPSIKFFGLFLDGNNGIAVDNMSIRGYAGIRHNNLNLDLAEQARPDVNYDLIILEYGINALTAEQKDYSAYTKVVGKSIDRIREAYPNADILLMGIGDRGVKHNGAVISMPTVANMIDAQRRLAKEKGILFWDTCLAMGGQGAVVEWAKNKEINKDYIHLSRNGGNRLGSLFTEALEKKMNE